MYFYDFFKCMFMIVSVCFIFFIWFLMVFICFLEFFYNVFVFCYNVFKRV